MVAAPIGFTAFRHPLGGLWSRGCARRQLLRNRAFSRGSRLAAEAQEEVILIPLWLREYERRWLRRDLTAGMATAAYVVPASMAYATLAGLPPVTGLYCYLFAGLAYPLGGTSRQAAIGPTSAIAILVGSTLADLTFGNATRLVPLAAATALMVGAINVIAWLFRAGQVVHFISDTVLTGFKAGVALQIASTQLPKLIGVNAAGDGFLARIVDLAGRLGETHVLSLAVGAGGLLLLLAGERLLPRRPTILLVVVLSVGVSALLHLSAAGVAVLGPLPSGLPQVGVPAVGFDDLRALLPLALACFLLSYIESASVVRSFGLAHGYPVDVDRELLALGASNVAVALGQGFPVAAGMSQSAVNDKAGAHTPLAIVVTSIIIGLAVVYLSDVFRDLPTPMLAALVLFAVRGLVNVPELRRIRRVSRTEFRLALVALVGVVVLGVLWGVLVAAVLSLLLLIARAAHPHTAVLYRIPGTTQFGDAERHPGSLPVSGLVIFRAYGGIVYFNVQHVRSALLDAVRLHQPGVEHVIVDLSSSPTVDLAGVSMLRAVAEELSRAGLTLDLAEARGAVRDLLSAAELDAQFGAADRTLAAIVGQHERTPTRDHSVRRG